MVDKCYFLYSCLQTSYFPKAMRMQAKKQLTNMPESKG